MSKAKTTQPGYVNRNRQIVPRNTGLRGNGNNQLVYELRYPNCSHVYGANGADIFEREMPQVPGR
jgi:hypothetical protein